MVHQNQMRQAFWEDKEISDAVQEVYDTSEDMAEFNEILIEEAEQSGRTKDEAESAAALGMLEVRGHVVGTRFNDMSRNGGYRALMCTVFGVVSGAVLKTSYDMIEMAK